MEQRALRISYRSRLMLAAFFIMLGAGFYASNARSGDSSTSATAAGPQNSLGQSLSPQAQNELVTLIAMARLADLRWPSFIDYREQILTFYEAGASLIRFPS